MKIKYYKNGQVLQGFCNEVALYNHLYYGFKKTMKNLVKPRYICEIYFFFKKHTIYFAEIHLKNLLETI